jgi:hypothetical protein
MGLLTFALNVTLDGCCDHREMVVRNWHVSDVAPCQTQVCKCTKDIWFTAMGKLS